MIARCNKFPCSWYSRCPSQCWTESQCCNHSPNVTEATLRITPCTCHADRQSGNSCNGAGGSVKAVHSADCSLNVLSSRWKSNVQLTLSRQTGGVDLASNRKIYHILLTKKKAKGFCTKFLLHLAVGIRRTLLSKPYHHVDEASVVLHTLLGAALGLFLFVLLVHLGRLTAHLTGTSQRSVHLSCNIRKQARANNVSRRFLSLASRCSRSLGLFRPASHGSGASRVPSNTIHASLLRLFLRHRSHVRRGIFPTCFASGALSTSPAAFPRPLPAASTPAPLPFAAAPVLRLQCVRSWRTHLRERTHDV